MRKRLVLVIALLTVIGVLNVPVQAQNKNTLSIHPISLIVSTAVDILPVTIYVTYERQTEGQNALILTPNMFFWNLSSDDEELSLTGFGIGAGMRHYLSKEKQTHGIYLQVKGNFAFTSATYKNDFLGDDDSGTGFDLEGLFHIGYKGQWDKISMFFDVGLGYAYSKLDMSLGSFDISSSGSGLGADINLGLGYSF
jgi:hypothetical protein